MGNSRVKESTPFLQETPRRDAVRTMSAGVAGAALLGALGLAATSTEAKSKSKQAKAEKKGKKGKTGPQGPQGPAGATGPRGAAGSISLADLVVTERNGAASNVGDGQTLILQAACIAGEVLIGGGYNLDDTRIAPCEIIDVGIVGGNWGVEISCPAGDSAANVRATALCLGQRNS